MEETEIGLPLDYIGGLLDMSSRVSFDLHMPESENESPRVTKSIDISVGYDASSAGLLEEYFESLGINVQFREGSGIRTSIRKREYLERLEDSLEGHSIELMRGLKFFNSREFNRDDLTKDNESLLRFIKTILKIRPAKRSSDRLKYSPSEIAKRLGIREMDVEPFDIPSIPIDSELSIDYIGGVFDGCGRHSISVAKTPTFSLGYSLRPELVMNRTSLHPVTVSLIQDTLTQRDVPHNVSSQSDVYQLYIKIQGLERMRSFYREFGDGIQTSFQETEMFMKEILPRFDEELHTTKQGFYDILYLAEVELDLFKRDKKYGLSYFSEKWNEDIDTYGYDLETAD